MWYLYKEKVYDIKPYEQHAKILKTKAIYILPRVPMFRGYLRGHSGVVEYGAHMDKLNMTLLNEIIHNGKIIPEPCIAKRLRYSERDGGKHFDSYRKQVQRYIGKIESFLEKLWKGKYAELS